MKEHFREVYRRDKQKHICPLWQHVHAFPSSLETVGFGDRRRE